jgi:hypothetical protein
MKNLFFFAAFFLAAFVSSCSKDSANTATPVDNRQECEKNNTGDLLTDNWKKDPYYIYIDNEFKGEVGGYGENTISGVVSGYHTAKVVQKSGYTLYASTYSASINIVKCGKFTLEIKN